MAALSAGVGSCPSRGGPSPRPGRPAHRQRHPTAGHHQPFRRGTHRIPSHATDVAHRTRCRPGRNRCRQAPDTRSDDRGTQSAQTARLRRGNMRLRAARPARHPSRRPGPPARQLPRPHRRPRPSRRRGAGPAPPGLDGLAHRLRRRNINAGLLHGNPGGGNRRRDRQTQPRRNPDLPRSPRPDLGARPRPGLDHVAGPTGQAQNRTKASAARPGAGGPSPRRHPRETAQRRPGLGEDPGAALRVLGHLVREGTCRGYRAADIAPANPQRGPRDRPHRREHRGQCGGHRGQIDPRPRRDDGVAVIPLGLLS